MVFPVRVFTKLSHNGSVPIQVTLVGDGVGCASCRWLSRGEAAYICTVGHECQYIIVKSPPDPSW